MDIKEEMTDMPESSTTTISSSCTCKCDDTLGSKLKTEHSTVGYFENHSGYYKMKKAVKTEESKNEGPSSLVKEEL